MAKLCRRYGILGTPASPSQSMDAPNNTWCIDFKGELKTGDGQYCYPLTVTDGCTGFILGCHGRRSTAHDGATPVLHGAG